MGKIKKIPKMMNVGKYCETLKSYNFICYLSFFVSADDNADDLQEIVMQNDESCDIEENSNVSSMFYKWTD